MTTTEIAELAELTARFGREGAVSFAASSLGGVVATLRGGDGSVAEIALRGAHVLGYRSPDHGAVLWLSPLARLDDGRAVRGGVPICWPWFGAHPSEPGRPSHGIARTAPWHVVATGAEPSLSLSIDETAARASGIDVSAQLDLSLANGLSLALTTHNRGAVPARLTGALHSYFAVSDIADVTVEGLDGRPFIDQLDGGLVKTQVGPIRFGGEVDRIYRDGGNAVAILDPGLSRRIIVTKAGSASTVVWNPWQAKADRLGDLGHDGYRSMVCVETANAGDDVVGLAPGASHTLAARITVSSA